MFWECESTMFLPLLFLREFSLLHHVIRIKNNIRGALFIRNDIISGIKVLLIIDFGGIGVPFTQKVDNVLDDLRKDLLFPFKLVFELVLKSSVFTGKKLILLKQANTDLLELDLAGFHFVDFCFEGKINILGFERNGRGNFVCLLKVLWNAWKKFEIL